MTNTLYVAYRMCSSSRQWICVLQGIVELCKKGVFAAAQTKKWCYWPKNIPGETIVLHFATKDVGHIDDLQGQLDGVCFHVICRKEEDYVSMLILTYGTQEWMGNEKYHKLMEGNIRRFKYPEVPHNHFRYRHLVDDHNSKRHQPISLEVVWATQEWSCRHFAFLLVVMEVNVKLALEHFGGHQDKGMIAFCKQFAQELVNNDYLEREAAEPHSPAAQSKEMDHVLISLPHWKKFCGTEMVVSKLSYPQTSCIRCHAKTRSYCKCSPGTYHCQHCFFEHCQDSENHN